MHVCEKMRRNPWRRTIWWVGDHEIWWQAVVPSLEKRVVPGKLRIGAPVLGLFHLVEDVNYATNIESIMDEVAELS